MTEETNDFMSRVAAISPAAASAVANGEGLVFVSAEERDALLANDLLRAVGGINQALTLGGYGDHVNAVIVALHPEIAEAEWLDDAPLTRRRRVLTMPVKE